MLRANGVFFISAIINDPRFFQCDQTAFHHFIEHGQEGVDFFLGIHDFDDERQIK